MSIWWLGMLFIQCRSHFWILSVFDSKLIIGKNKDFQISWFNFLEFFCQLKYTKSIFCGYLCGECTLHVCPCLHSLCWSLKSISGVFNKVSWSLPHTILTHNRHKDVFDSIICKERIWKMSRALLAHEAIIIFS